MRALQRLRHWAQGLNPAPDDTAIDAPLLDPSEILDLLQRAQADQPTATAADNIAHRQLGDAASRYRGQGMDQEESRAYQPGDDIRHMNWRLSARSGALQMKLFREERRPGVFILIDRRAAMRFGTRRRLKVTQAARAAAIAAFAASGRSASVAGVILQRHPQWLPGACGEQAAFTLIQAAAAPCPPQPVAHDEPSLGATLRELQTQLIPGSTLYLLSDFIDLADSDRPTLQQLASDNRVHALLIHDPAELDLPQAGKLQVIAADDAPARLLDSGDDTVRETYRAAAQAHFAQRETLLRSLGIDCQRLPTTEDAVENRVPLS